LRAPVVVGLQPRRRAFPPWEKRGAARLVKQGLAIAACLTVAVIVWAVLAAVAR
jgi:hypothetical protein